MHPSPRLLLLFALTILLVPAAARAGRPNVVLIVADDLGWADVGYHNAEIRSPNLDRLAETGVELHQHYVMPQCTPTRVALLTGRYPSRFGRHAQQASNEQAVPFGTPTFASVLKEAGYDTALIGKWHLGSLPKWGPNHYGFDYAYGSLAGAVGMYDHRYRLNQPQFSTTWHRDGEFIEEVGHATDLTLAEAIKWLERPRDRPFFLYLPFHAVHTPITEEPRWLAMNRHIENTDRMVFAAAVTHMDYAIGKVVEALDRLGVREDTIIIFTSDNGGITGRYPGGWYPPPDPPLADFSSNAPLRGQKIDVYEGGIRVPALVSWPGTLSPRRVEAPLHAVDWLATLAKLCGVELPEDVALDGVDVTPALRGEQTELGQRELYWVWGGASQRVALRSGSWKLLRPGPNAAFELFNLETDPYETTDMASSRPEMVQRLMERLAAQRALDAEPSEN